MREEREKRRRDKRAGALVLGTAERSHVPSAEMQKPRGLGLLRSRQPPKPKATPWLHSDLGQISAYVSSPAAPSSSCMDDQ